MESRNKLAMCRLCLCENESFINVFELNDGQGYVAAEVISDLLRFQVSQTDGYPHVVCSKCLVKLTDFKLFKECCQKSIVTYENMFVSRKNMEENKPKMLEFVTVKAEPILYSDDLDNISKDVGSELDLCDPDPLRVTSPHVTIKSEEVIIDSCPVSDDPLIETEVSCGPILLKYEVLPFSRDNHQQEAGHDGSDLELGEQDPLRDATCDVKLTSLETVTHPQYPQCLDYKRPQCTPKGEIDGDSCAWSINDKSKNISSSEDVIASSCGTMERLDEQRILQGESMCMVPFFQQDNNIEKEVKENRRMMEGDIGGEGEGRSRTITEKRVKERSEELECFHCGTMLMSKLSLTKHMKVHGFVNSYNCAICGKVFRYNCSLKRHVMTHTGSRPYKCAQCGKCFSQNGHLIVHMRTHMGSKPHKCTQCGKIYTQSSSLKTHIQSHTGFKPCKCTECGKSFTRNNDLIVHMRTHTGNKPYKCEECHKRFSQNSNLKMHMKTHTGSKPYKCAVCCKFFSQNGNLKIHMQSHSGSKPHKCTECSKSFSRSRELKIHMKTHTGYKPYKCAECCKCFSQKCYLKNHMKTHMF